MATCSKNVCDGDEESIQVSDNSRWMEKLPQHLHKIPLNQLAIPGSHDSFTFYLDKSGPVSPDEPPLIRKFGNLGRCAKNIVYNWSAVQSLSIRRQLDAGIRYFDIRVGAKAHCSDLYCVHGLFGPCIADCLEKIASFLDDHSSEVVFLDFNHFYDFDDDSHLCLIGKLHEWLGSKLCPFITDMNKVTLKFMLKHGFQVIVFYHSCVTRRFSQLWPGCIIDSPWPESLHVPDLLQKLEQNYEEGRDISLFYVTQGVLTPTVSYVVWHLYTTLKQSLVREAARPFVEWLKSKIAGQEGINICIMDCVELENYIESVIQLNYSLTESMCSLSLESSS